MPEIVIIIIAVLALLAAAAIITAIFHRRKAQPVPEEENDGTYFTSQLVEMLDTISRATLERDCCEFTEMLYEQARFCEPTKRSELRPLEQEILKAICRIHPDDNDELITEKCAVISELLERRQSMMYDTAEKQEEFT